jgi:hypothetical protein
MYALKNVTLLRRRQSTQGIQRSMRSLPLESNFLSLLYLLRICLSKLYDLNKGRKLLLSYMVTHLVTLHVTQPMGQVQWIMFWCRRAS